MTDRTCTDCGADISWMHGGNKTCIDCRIALMRRANLEPLEAYRGAQEKWRCRCLTCGAEVAPRFTNIQQGWGACPTCRRAAQARARSLPEQDAVAALCAAGLEPLEPYQNVMTPWRSRCRYCGKEVMPVLNNLKKGQGGCIWCGKHAVDPEYAAGVMQAAGLEPLVAYPGRHTPWQVLCMRCEQTVSPTYGAVCTGTGCRECGVSGFKASQAAVVYLIMHFGYDAAKIGIADTSGARLAQHRRQGWQLLALVEVPGRVAMSIEAAILNWWRGDLRLPVYLGRTEMPQSGYTETVEASSVNLAATISRMREMAGLLGAEISSLTSAPRN